MSLPTTAEWKRAIRSAMRAEGVGQHDLAIELQTSQSGISQTLGEKQTRSVLVAPLSERFGVTMPYQARLELAADRLVALFGDDALRPHVEALEQVIKLAASHG